MKNYQLFVAIVGCSVIGMRNAATTCMTRLPLSGASSSWMDHAVDVVTEVVAAQKEDTLRSWAREEEHLGQALENINLMGKLIDHVPD